MDGDNKLPKLNGKIHPDCLDKDGNILKGKLLKKAIRKIKVESNPDKNVANNVVPSISSSDQNSPNSAQNNASPIQNSTNIQTDEQHLTHPNGKLHPSLINPKTGQQYTGKLYRAAIRKLKIEANNTSRVSIASVSANEPENFDNLNKTVILTKSSNPDLSNSDSTRSRQSSSCKPIRESTVGQNRARTRKVSTSVKSTVLTQNRGKQQQTQKVVKKDTKPIVSQRKYLFSKISKECTFIGQ